MVSNTEQDRDGPLDSLREAGEFRAGALFAGGASRWLDGAAILLSLAAVLAAYWVGARVFEHIPHLEDEFAYVWQAQAIAGGRATLPTPPHENSFLIPFVVDANGQRFGKYPLGWPVLLGIGERLGAPGLVNPLLAGLGIWLTYLLGKRLFNPGIGLLAAALTLTSPFFLMNSGVLLSHPMGLVLSAAFALAWLESFGGDPDVQPAQSRLALVAAACALGGLAISRPLTAIGVAAPFIIQGIVLFLRESGRVRRRLVIFIGIVAAIGSLQFLWQYAASGDPFLNLYTLWWEYDRVGFGPGFGRYDHNLDLALFNTRFSLWSGRSDLFGWGRFSWIFLPFGLWAVLKRRAWDSLLVSSVFFSLILTYMFYWVGAWLFGPRYYYEGFYSVTLLSAVGLAVLAGWPLSKDVPGGYRKGIARLRPLGVTAVLALLISLNMIFYTPLRLGGMVGLFGIDTTRLAPFTQAAEQGLAPALIIVHPDDWREYGGLLSLQTPYLDTPFIFTISRGPNADQALTETFVDRRVYHYYPEPYRFVEYPGP